MSGLKLDAVAFVRHTQSHRLRIGRHLARILDVGYHE
jgi:hypothetical protein